MLVRILRQAFLATYLFLTACALLYTLGRKQVPKVHWAFVTHFYAMMAPFQNYTTDNAELMIYGKTRDGSMQKIDKILYFPQSRGEFAIRSRMSSFSQKRAKYMELAKRIYELEHDRGRAYVSVIVRWEKWPKSEYGFYTNYLDDDIVLNPMAEYTP